MLEGDIKEWWQGTRASESRGGHTASESGATRNKHTDKSSVGESSHEGDSVSNRPEGDSQCREMRNEKEVQSNYEP